MDLKRWHWRGQARLSHCKFQEWEFRGCFGAHLQNGGGCCFAGAPGQSSTQKQKHNPGNPRIPDDNTARRRSRSSDTVSQSPTATGCLTREVFYRLHSLHLRPFRNGYCDMLRHASDRWWGAHHCPKVTKGDKSHTLSPPKCIPDTLRTFNAAESIHRSSCSHCTSSHF